MQINTSVFSAHLQQYLTSQETLHSEHQHILLACMPKSASRTALALLEGHASLDHISLNETDSNLSESLDSLKLLLYQGRNWVAHHHVHCALTLPTQLKRFSIRTITLTRNLFDVCVSIRDHMLKAARHGGLVMFAHIIPHTPEFADWSEQEQLDFIIVMAIPWYVKFYASWHMIAPSQDYHPLWIDYDQLIGHPLETTRTMFAHCGLDYDVESLSCLVATVMERQPNFNVDRRGRGEESLTKLQKDKIRHLCCHYPAVDFSRLGV
ncbi:sulfotransferase domain-containing protein [Aestuariispira insulae]|uniref:Sulfotransferase domain-containing protein n=1 Tax=Aestuariispira insulae TaxID=1461337 RepID=A0A3D9HJL4_9PROT|nr:sulfotransferase domain-containing protein [Aestuariispira insulae]RED49644.1 sulfotransferase domain-containing protein [Aestuariispira insulae]